MLYEPIFTNFVCLLLNIITIFYTLSCYKKISVSYKKYEHSILKIIQYGFMFILFVETEYFLCELLWIFEESSTQIFAFSDLMWTITETCYKILNVYVVGKSMIILEILKNKEKE